MATITINKTGFALGTIEGCFDTIFLSSLNSSSELSKSLISLKNQIDLFEDTKLSETVQTLISVNSQRTESLWLANKKIIEFMQDVRTIDEKVADMVRQLRKEFNLQIEYTYSNSTFLNGNEYLNDNIYAVIEAAKTAAAFASGHLKHSGAGISFDDARKEKMIHRTENNSDNKQVTYDYIESSVYSHDNESMYGSDQGSAAAIAKTSEGEITPEENRFIDIIKKNKKLKNMSDNELYEYLSGMNHEGCGYASTVNTVFEYYINIDNGSELFRRKFGFSLRKRNGDLNYDLLMVYIYSKYDNVKKSGLSHKDEDNLIKKVMAEKGIDGKSKVKVKTKEYGTLTNNEIKNYLAEGKQVIISSQNVVLYNMDGTLLQNCAGAGHSLSVTGVTSDGRIIVSTWGKKAYVDRSDEGNFQSKTVLDENGNSQVKQGIMSMDFSVVEF